MADNKIAYGTGTAMTCTLASLATSSTRVAGRQSTSVDNSTNLYLDYIVSGKISVGTTPTANTFIEVWIIPKGTDGNWPDTFGATDAAVTVTSREMLFSYGTLLVSIPVPVATSNVAYAYNRSLLSKFAVVPKEWCVWVTHSTAVNLNSTGGNHVVEQMGVYTTTT